MSDLPKPSSWTDHPSRNPNGLYKFIDLNIKLSQSIRVTTRQTYDILTWLGDCGGLKDGIFGLGSIIIQAFQSYSMNTLLLTTVFRMT